MKAQQKVRRDGSDTAVFLGATMLSGTIISLVWVFGVITELGVVQLVAFSLSSWMGTVVLAFVARRKGLQRYRKALTSLLDFRTIYRLLDEQLADTVAETEKYIVEAVKECELLYREADKEMSLIRDTVSFLSEEEKKMLSAIETNHDVLFREELHRRITKLEEEAVGLRPLVASIRGIARWVSLVALNAAVQAAKSGGTSQEFSVTADEIRRCAGRTDELAGEIEGIIEGYLRRMNEFISDLTGFLGQLEATSQLVRYFRKLTHDNIEKIHAQNTIVCRVVTDLLGKVQFQDVLRQRIEKVREGLGEVSLRTEELVSWAERKGMNPGVKDPKAIIEGLYGRYVMYSQRKVHMHVTGDRKKGVKEGPRIELF